ncbi:hypothetical protein AGMMS50212_01800 [Spirochaetia bacterium]|nr:hypothetical protein AGMMS50212_01800 [Spirochaetia bacterium]
MKKSFLITLIFYLTGFTGVFGAETDIITTEAETHVVLGGETLSHVAAEFYGKDNALFFPIITTANKSITNPDRLTPGSEIIIPNLKSNLENPTAKAAVRKSISDAAARYKRLGGKVYGPLSNQLLALLKKLDDNPQAIINAAPVQVAAAPQQTTPEPARPAAPPQPARTEAAKTEPAKPAPPPASPPPVQPEPVKPAAPPPVQKISLPEADNSPEPVVPVGIAIRPYGPKYEVRTGSVLYSSAPLGVLVIVDRNGAEQRRSDVDTIHTESLNSVGGRIFAIADIANQIPAARLVEINPDTLRRSAAGQDAIHDSSKLWIKSGDLYAITIQNKKSYIARFNKSLQRLAMSELPLHPYATVTFNNGNIVTQNEKGGIMMLEPKELKPVR